MKDFDYIDWIDNADSYICPRCRFECNSPLYYSVTATCPRCGFTPEKYKTKPLVVIDD